MNPIVMAFIGKLLSSVTLADGVVLGIVLVSAGLGFFSGFVWQILRIVGLVVAFWLAARFHSVVAGWFSPQLTSHALAIAFACLFLGVVLAAYVLMLIIRKPVDAMKPEFVDRVLGALFGVVKGLLVCGIVALVLFQYGARQSSVRRQVSASPSARFTAECVRSLWWAVSGGASGTLGQDLK